MSGDELPWASTTMWRKHQIELERRSYVLEKLIDTAYFKEWEGTDRYSFPQMRRELLHQVYLREARQTVTYPADWWQAVKARFFPAWLLKRYPVRHASVTVEAQALFPELRPIDRWQHIIYVTDALREPG